MTGGGVGGLLFWIFQTRPFCLGRARGRAGGGVCLLTYRRALFAARSGDIIGPNRPKLNMLLLILLCFFFFWDGGTTIYLSYCYTTHDVGMDREHDFKATAPSRLACIILTTSGCFWWSIDWRVSYEVLHVFDRVSAVHASKSIRWIADFFAASYSAVDV